MDSFYPKDASAHSERGDHANNAGKLLSSISHGLRSVVAAFLLKLSSSYFFFNIYFLFICDSCGMWESPSLTGDQTHTSCNGSMKS